MATSVLGNLGTTIPLPTDAPPEVRVLLEAAAGQLAVSAWTGRDAYADGVLVRDQLEGGAAALSDRYHLPLRGLTEDQQREVAHKKRHINLVEPALDRLVNAIHSGRVVRSVPQDEVVQRWVRRRRHGKAMADLCESAFAYGTGYLVPVLRGGNVRYWLPDPLWTILVVEPTDVESVVGVVQHVRSDGDAWTIGARFVGRGFEGEYFWADTSNRPLPRPALRVAAVPTRICPVIVAYGRDRRHMGRRYGKSLVVAAAEASIAATNNNLNMSLLRDRQTQSLLILWGTPESASKDTRAAGQRYVKFSERDRGDAKYVTPESRMDDVVSVAREIRHDAAVAMGLPLDTFRPDLVAGSDASATAARIRAFPLAQRMARLVAAWEQTEMQAMALLQVLRQPELAAEADGVEDLEEIAERTAVAVRVMPSVPESEQETIANWQSLTEKYFVPVRAAIEYYSGHLTDDEKQRLQTMWEQKHAPGSEEAALAYRREIVKALSADGTISDVLANLIELGELVQETGLPRHEAYVEPFLPVQDDQGRPVTGDVVTDAAGDVVGGAVAGGDIGDGGQGESDEEDGDGDAGGGGADSQPGQRGGDGAHQPGGGGAGAGGRS